MTSMRINKVNKQIKLINEGRGKEDKYGKWKEWEKINRNEEIVMNGKKIIMLENGLNERNDKGGKKIG